MSIIVVGAFIRRACTVTETCRIAGGIFHFRELIATIGIGQVVNQTVSVTLQALNFSIRKNMML